jgi:phage tail protein X
MAISLRGTVQTQEGRPLEGVIVRLIGSEEPLGDVRTAAVRRPDAVSWDRIITGYAGHRWNCWQRFVMNQVAGITWAEFRDQVIEQNPVLVSDGYLFKASRRYRLPQQVSDRPDIAWSRSIRGFSGNRWQCWETFVQGKVDGLTWNEFMDQVVTQNPALRDDGYVFQAGKTYRLPENVQGPTEVTWTRMLTGFSGNRWQCWEAHVHHQVEGITWAEFMPTVVEQNPSLAADGYVFQAGKTYVLPENRVKPLYYLFA